LQIVSWFRIGFQGIFPVVFWDKTQTQTQTKTKTQTKMKVVLNAVSLNMTQLRGPFPLVRLLLHLKEVESRTPIVCGV
jgi:carbohydrate-binding DOMON domain-containing protein